MFILTALMNTALMNKSKSYAKIPGKLLNSSLLHDRVEFYVIV